MDRLFFSALLLVRNESKEFTIASTRMSTERGDRTDREGVGVWVQDRRDILICPFFVFYLLQYIPQILGICFCGLVSPL